MSYSKDGTNISYQYNADGLRTKQLIYDEEGRVANEVVYIWDNGQLVGYTAMLHSYTEENSSVSQFFDVKIHYDEASEPYAVTLGEETYYYIRNAVGDVKGLISADTGEYIYALDTSAYGVLSFVEPDTSFNTSGLIETQMELILKLMKKLVLRMCLCLPTANTYKGYSYDFFTGLYYLQSRYYDPEVGRFINADDVDYLGASGKPLSYNLFAYCENNPVNNSDPSGNMDISTVKKLIGKMMSISYQLIKTIVNRLGITKTGNCLEIKTSLVANTIDNLRLAFEVLSPILKVGTSVAKKVLKNAVKMYFKSNQRKVTTFLKNTAIPYIAKNFTSIIVKCFTLFVFRFKVEYKRNLYKDKLITFMLKNFSFYKWYNAVSSTGNIIAAILDTADGDWNGKIEIRIA